MNIRFIHKRMAQFYFLFEVKSSNACFYLDVVKTERATYQPEQTATFWVDIHVKIIKLFFLPDAVKLISLYQVH